MPGPAPAMQHLGKIRSFALELAGGPAQGVYRGGELLSGQVVLELSKVLKVRALEVCARGLATAHWLESRSVGMNTVYSDYTAYEPYLRSRYQLIRGESLAGQSRSRCPALPAHGSESLRPRGHIVPPSLSVSPCPALPVCGRLSWHLSRAFPSRLPPLAACTWYVACCGGEGPGLSSLVLFPGEDLVLLAACDGAERGAVPGDPEGSWCSVCSAQPHGSRCWVNTPQGLTLESRGSPLSLPKSFTLVSRTGRRTGISMSCAKL